MHKSTLYLLFFCYILQKIYFIKTILMIYIIYSLAIFASFILLCDDLLLGIKSFLLTTVGLFVAIFFFPGASEIAAFIIENAMYILAALLFFKISEKSNATAGSIAAGAVIVFDIVVL